MAGARSFRELDAWKLANALKLGVYELLQRLCVQRDHQFHDQIRNAAASAPRNIAEGFGRLQPRSAATTALLRYLRHSREPRTRTKEPPNHRTTHEPEP